MNQTKLMLVAAAGLLAVGSYSVFRSTGSETGRKDSQRTDVAAAKQQEKELAAEDQKKQAKPEVYFLNEAGLEAPANRPKANTLPKANGTRRISDVRAVTSAEEGDFMSPRWSPDG